MEQPDPSIHYARDSRWQQGSAVELERGVRRGELVRVGWGAYVSAHEWAVADGRARLRVRARAVGAVSRTEPVFSHETAAAFLGFPLIGKWPDRPTATVPRGGSESNVWVRRVRRALRPDECVRLDGGILVTSASRTALDLAASRSALSGIVTISHVRRHLAIPMDLLAADLAELGPAPGVARARRALERSTDGSDSRLETLVMVRCEDLGFQAPRQQFPVVGLDGAQYRCDFAWLDGAILGEADGRIKYEDGAFGADRTGADAVWSEKRREDSMRAVCSAFVRTDWSDAWQGVGLTRTLLKAGVPRPGRVRALTF